MHEEHQKKILLVSCCRERALMSLDREYIIPRSNLLFFSLQNLLNLQHKWAKPTSQRTLYFIQYIYFLHRLLMYDGINKLLIQYIVKLR